MEAEDTGAGEEEDENTEMENDGEEDEESSSRSAQEEINVEKPEYYVLFQLEEQKVAIQGFVVILPGEEVAMMAIELHEVARVASYLCTDCEVRLRLNDDPVEVVMMTIHGFKVAPYWCTDVVVRQQMNGHRKEAAMMALYMYEAGQEVLRGCKDCVVHQQVNGDRVEAAMMAIDGYEASQEVVRQQMDGNLTEVGSRRI